MQYPDEPQPKRKTIEIRPAKKNLTSDVFFVTLFVSGFIIFGLPAVWQANQSNNIPTPRLDVLAPFFPGTILDVVIMAFCTASIVTLFVTFIRWLWRRLRSGIEHPVQD